MSENPAPKDYLWCTRDYSGKFMRRGDGKREVGVEVKSVLASGGDAACFSAKKSLPSHSRMAPDYPPRPGITPAEWLPQMDIRIELGTMVRLMCDDKENYLPDTHLWQPRKT